MMIVNITLVLVAIVFVLHLLNVDLPSIGQASYYLDDAEPICVVDYNGETALLGDISLCCRELQKQLKCEIFSGSKEVDGSTVLVNRKCFTGKGELSYYVNAKTYNFCKQEGYVSYSVI